MAERAATSPRVPPSKAQSRKVPSSPSHRPVPSKGAPAEFGYRMPAEFEPHHCTWLTWPGKTSREWADEADLTADMLMVARAIRGFESVRVAVDPQFQADAARLLGPDFDLVSIPVDDIWTRDSGPTFLVNERGTLAATSWNFNAWGNKFDHHDRDVLLASRIAEASGAPLFTAGIVAEGGGLHVDGDGTVVVTESALLNSNRNPGQSREEVERSLNGWLGTRKVIWIPGPSHDTITDGHIDGQMTFARPGVALFEISDCQAHPGYHVLKEQLRALQLATDARGRYLEIAVLTRPADLPAAGTDFCGIYVNCLIVNGGVVIPEFGDHRTDAAAVEVFARAFPERRIVPLRIDAIAAGGGGIHCITQQQPRAGLVL